MSYWVPHVRLGRVQRAVYRVLEALDGAPASTTEIVAHSHALRLYQGPTTPMQRRFIRKAVWRVRSLMRSRRPIDNRWHASHVDAQAPLAARKTVELIAFLYTVAQAGSSQINGLAQPS